MSISPFDNDTFVAFIDISGFKFLMKKANKALDALDSFYQFGYDILQRNTNVEGIFISDCGILFTRNTDNIEQSLLHLLEVIKKLNQKMLNKGYMLTTSISYGPFKYQNKIEFERIKKNPIYGDAYLSAYLNSEIDIPKIQPGQCRIIIDKLPETINQILDNSNNESTNIIYKLIKKRKKDNKHWYYYWMVTNKKEIKEFEELYTDSYNLKFEGMQKALKKFK